MRFLRSIFSPSSTSCEDLRQRRARTCSLKSGVGGSAMPADAAEGVREARAGLLLEDVPDHLARLDEPEERREGAELHRHGAGARQVVADARELAERHPVPLAALGHGDAAAASRPPARSRRC